MHKTYFALIVALACLVAVWAVASEPRAPAPSFDVLQAMKHIRLPAGTRVELFAAEPLLANAVAFCFDEKGRCYVAETYRINHGVTDNREHMYWLDDDLASRTVADRVAMYRKH